MLFKLRKITTAFLSLLSIFVMINGISGLSYTTSYLGCFGDSSDRAMNALDRLSASSIHGWTIMGSFVYMPTTPTPVQTCANICSTFRLPYLGMQAAYACFCSAEGYDKYGMLPESSCGHNCEGNPSVKCGGDYTTSVYKINYSFDDDNKGFIHEDNAKSFGWLGIEGSESMRVNAFNGAACAYECFQLGSACASFMANATQGLCYLNKYLAASNTMNVWTKN